MCVSLFFPTTAQTSVEQCGTLLTPAKQTNRKKTISIIIGYTLALLILRDRKLASEKYMIVVVTQNKVGGGHNLIDSSAPFCIFQAFPLFFLRKKNNKLQLMCVNANPVFALFDVCMALNGV